MQIHVDDNRTAFHTDCRGKSLKGVSKFHDIETNEPLEKFGTGMILPGDDPGGPILFWNKDNKLVWRRTDRVLGIPDLSPWIILLAVPVGLLIVAALKGLFS